MTRPNFYKGRPVIQPYETYTVDGQSWQMQGAVSEIVDSEADAIAMSELVFSIENLDTGEKFKMGERQLQSKFIVWTTH